MSVFRKGQVNCLVTAGRNNFDLNSTFEGWWNLNNMQAYDSSEIATG